MKALFRKDLGWQAAWLAAAGLVAAAVFFSYGFEDIFVKPNSWYLMELLPIWWVGGLVLGLLAALLDELCGTEEYLRHRPVEPGRIFTVRIAGCVLVLSGLLFLPPLLVAAAGLASPDAVIAEWGRTWNLAAAATTAFSGFGAGLFAGTLRLPGFGRVLAGGACGLAVFLADRTAAAYLGAERIYAPARFAAFHLVLAALLVGAARVNYQRTYDPDHPLPTAALKGPVILAAAALAFLAAAGIGALQGVVQDTLLGAYPLAAALPGGPVKLVRWEKDRNDPHRTVLVEVDARHRFKAELPAGTTASIREGRCARWEPLRMGRGMDRNMRRFRSRAESARYLIGKASWGLITYVKGVGLFYLERKEGRVHLIHTAASGGGGPPLRRSFGKGPKERPFSPQVSAVAPLRVERNPLRLGKSKVLVGDPADGSVWVLDPTSDHGHFVRVPLPGGDRFRAWTGVSSSGEHRMRIAARGERSVYGWNGTDFEPVEAGRGPEGVPGSGSGIFRVTTLDPIRPEIEAVDDAGRRLFSHRYGPYTPREKGLCFLITGLSFFRPLFLEAAAFFAPPGEERVRFDADPLFDPLLRGSKRPGLLAALAAFQAVLALAAFRRLKTLGAPGTRRAYWAFAVFAAGAAAYLLHLLVERPRAYGRPRSASSVEPPPLLIRSAPAAASPPHETFGCR